MERKDYPTRRFPESQTLFRRVNVEECDREQVEGGVTKEKGNVIEDSTGGLEGGVKGYK